MAPYKITSTSSILTTANFDHAFDLGSAGADSLVVDAEAFLVARGVDSYGALLDAGPWTVTINGSVISQQFYGIVLAGFNPALSSTITIGANGQVSGGTSGIALTTSATVKNSGIIEGLLGPGIAIFDAGTRTITNTGTIRSIVDVDGLSNDKVTNSGTLFGLDLAGGNDSLNNSGTVSGTVFLGSGNNTLVNSGTLTAGVEGGGGNDVMTNSKVITGDVRLGSGINVLNNSGKISVTVYGGADADTISNSGTIDVGIGLGEGVNRLTNSGTITGLVTGGDNVDTVTNSKTINGNLLLGGGNDVVTNTGTITGVVSLGAGDDGYTGGGLSDAVDDSDGADKITLGAGNDIYFATGATADGLDTIDGGAGNDTYSAGGAGSKLEINIDTVGHDLGALSPGDFFVAAKTATGASVAGALKDTISGFENVSGGLSDDIIYGSASANSLFGGGGGDVLFGYGGNDLLSGDAGSDTVVGGAGKDQLYGGANADFFYFLSIKDSGITATTRDTIMDMEVFDTISLSRIDANTLLANDQAFTFIGTNVVFGDGLGNGVAGQLRAYWTASGQIIEGDVNGDRKADFSIEIMDPTHQLPLGSGFFDL